jgi:3D (Asp-Asp-Asp) domain-containing protein
MKLHSMKKTLAGLALSLSIAGFAMPANAAQSSSTYVTGANDTFWLVSKKLNINVNELMAANPSINPLNVYKGLTLTLPNGKKSAAAVKAQSAAAPPQMLTNAVATASGKPVAYSKVINAVATAYSEVPEENGGWGGVDYFGNSLKIGTIAVDPNVIPLGTKVYITGYTSRGLPLGGLVATATDIGGAIKGNRVDIFLPSSIGPVADFGIQNVQIYVMK